MTTDLRADTVAWLSTLLDSASTEVIGVSNWWPRATSALEAAATASTYGEAVAIATRKLQIESYTASTADALTRLEQTIGGSLEEWAAIVSDEAPYLVALARATRKSRRKSKPATTPAPNAPDALTVDPKELF